uniref:Uncharacterized protein n=1 Tax=Hemiselmis andersenii TaxID=464988 RepID=A0A7S1GZ42_HEMAN|mmetsp:Transcript_26291/g.63770  ORF Transcript_26291/g.63770 Transcript_26291/m.63770 type:complete len:185 (+) Transcript_26291:266-820(+)
MSPSSRQPLVQTVPPHHHPVAPNIFPRDSQPLVVCPGLTNLSPHQADYIACTLFTSMVFKFIMLPCCVQLFASDGCARRFVLCQLPVLAFQLFSITMCQWSNRAYTMPWRIFRNSLLVPGFLLLWGILAVWAEASELEQQRMEREQSLRDAKPRTRASEAAMASMQPMMEPSPARADAPFMVSE